MRWALGTAFLLLFGSVAGPGTAAEIGPDSDLCAAINALAPGEELALQPGRWRCDDRPPVGCPPAFAPHPDHPRSDLQILDDAVLILLCHRLLRNAIFPKEINRLTTCAQKY